MIFYAFLHLIVCLLYIFSQFSPIIWTDKKRMHHCIPGRKLWPETAPIHNGMVITTSLHGNFMHYVFSDKDTPLYRMPASLFKCNNTFARKNTEIIRLEKALEFGDNISFTADANNVIEDYEKGLQVHETCCNRGLYLVKTVCILPPVDKEPLRIWSDFFGWINLDQEQSDQLHAQAEADVPIYTWVSVKVQGNHAAADFYEFIEIAVDERKNVWDAEWNLSNQNRPKGSSYKWEHTDEEDEDEPEFIEKKDEQVLDVKLHLEGCLIGPKELYCKALKDDRVFVGLWDKHIGKTEDNNNWLGYRCKFDAYYSDIHNAYIAYYCEFGEEDEDWLCDVWFADDDNPQLLSVTTYPSEVWGCLYKTYFGLVADKHRLLGTLPHMFINPKLYGDDEKGKEKNGEDVEEEEEEEEEFSGEVEIYIVDTGPGKHKLCRFELYHILPEKTQQLVDRANYLAAAQEEFIEQDGFIYDSYKRLVFSPKYSTQRILFPSEEIRNFPVGYWFKFQARFNTQKCAYILFWCKLDADRDIIPHTRTESIKRGKTVPKYEFKIEAELVSGDELAKERLYSPIFGFIADSEGKFQPKKQVMKYKVIVTPAGRSSTKDDGGVTHFKFVRMAEKNEKMQCERKPKVKDIPYNEDNVQENGDEEDDGLAALGLDLADVEVEDPVPVSQVEYLQDYSRRERLLRARERKRARDRAEKRMMEELKGEGAGNGDEAEAGDGQLNGTGEGTSGSGGQSASVPVEELDGQKRGSEQLLPRAIALKKP